MKINSFKYFYCKWKKVSFKAMASKVYYGVYYIIIKVNSDQKPVLGNHKKNRKKCTRI